MKEIFVVYRDWNGPEIEFSKFCELRLKWCITIGSAETHSVCAQFTKLQTNALQQFKSNRITNAPWQNSLQHRIQRLHAWPL